jgi:phosphoribosylformimino-5-aminoimidazole carboxamide ribotide isomerase
MEFRPCIDIHNGKVKQIVGSSLTDTNDGAQENFVSPKDAAWYAHYYKERKLKGGHIILLNPIGSAYYEATKEQALRALREYPDGMQVGGGIRPQNASDFLDAGASHVIVTSYVFRDGNIDYENLEQMSRTVGKEHLVLDLSCRKKEGAYFIVTDRWQKFTQEKITYELLAYLSGYAAEFLIHAVDVEGKVSGIEEELASYLGNWDGIPVTYAGGVSGISDIHKLKRLGQDHVHVTIGSALDLFGGSLSIEEVIAAVRSKEKE